MALRAIATAILPCRGGSASSHLRPFFYFFCTRSKYGQANRGAKRARIISSGLPKASPGLSASHCLMLYRPPTHDRRFQNPEIELPSTHSQRQNIHRSNQAAVPNVPRHAFPPSYRVTHIKRIASLFNIHGWLWILSPSDLSELTFSDAENVPGARWK